MVARCKSRKPPHQIYHEHFASEQGKEATDIFVMLPSTDDPIPVKSQIDMVYGLLHARIRRGVPRDTFDSFEMLITKARSIETSYMDSSVDVNKSIKVKEEEKSKTPRQKCSFCGFYGHLIANCRKRAKEDTVKKSELVEVTTRVK